MRRAILIAALAVSGVATAEPTMNTYIIDGREYAAPTSQEAYALWAVDPATELAHQRATARWSVDPVTGIVQKKPPARKTPPKPQQENPYKILAGEVLR